MRFRPLFHRTRRSRPAGVRPESDAAQLVRLGSLLEVVARAVALQANANGVILACALPGETPSLVGRQGHVVAAEYSRLAGWAADLAGADGPDTLPGRISQLLRYHTEMLDMCLNLAFPNYRSPKLERRRLALSGLGEPAAVLRDSEIALRLWISELAAAASES
ncbi:MAG TPA: hypothetical protein VHW44_12100 [Pseudonocardiaceae bacterium]|jgi:hypothetical protein|nr:hypothetical protein [Pseudonocardiaceae bacterium]